MDEIKQEVEGLKNQINQLEKENARLENELKNMREQEADIFSSTKETERMALKHQVKGLISKIDEHLDKQA